MVTEVNLIPMKGYLIELQPICVDHHDRSDPEIPHPETLSSIPLLTPLVRAHWASVPRLDLAYRCHGSSHCD